jgi:hypothetical protein
MRLVGAEDFGQRFAVDKTLAPFVKLVTAGGADSILKASGPNLLN